MQSNNLLLVPFRKSVPISLSNTIRKYIGIKYDQHEIAFKDDLQSIDNLRKDAINVQEPHISGVFKLQKYAAQLGLSPLRRNRNQSLARANNLHSLLEFKVPDGCKHPREKVSWICPV